ncbi:uncharacterized protein LOC141732341 [Larus michahellis]|uniref:uncharacterized protein LOC141732341 n=1 Tax=Larus michahellis TaxID=119627 RepID=UPI003D9BF9E7
MGGIFGKNKRIRVFPKRVVLYKAKGKKPLETVRTFCDASTWTGENHFHSARIGRTPKGPEPSAAKLVWDTPESESAAQAQWETGEQAASLRAQHTEAPGSVTARDAQDVEVSQDPEAKPSTEVMQHQELAERTKEAAQAAVRSPQESRKTEAVLHPAGSCISNKQLSCEDHEVTPLTQSTVKAEVHMSADVQGGPGKVQSATAESELLSGAEQEAGVVCASEETCVGKTPQEEPVQKAADSPAAVCAMEESESEMPLKATETREGVTDVQRSAEEQAVEEEVDCAAKAPPDLQLEQHTEVPVTEDMEENAFKPEQAEEMAEVCDDGQTSKERPCCLSETQAALQDKEIKASNGGKPEER